MNMADDNDTPTILLVDDDENDRLLTGRALKKAGYQVLTAENGRQALDILQEQGAGIGLVVTDKDMPEMDGIALAKQLKTQFPDLPVLMQTGDPSPRVTEQAEAAGVDGITEKASAYDALLDMVREYLSCGPSQFPGSMPSGRGKG